MLLQTPMTKTQTRALARDIRKMIEPDKARTTRILSECELRRTLINKDKLHISGIYDVVQILQSAYKQVTVNRLLTKVQKSIVWDTSLCRRPMNELKESFFNSESNIIITTDMYDELLKLANSSKNDEDVQTARELALLILEDTDSNHCVIVDLPKESYVDNQLLHYCIINQCELATCDYLLGLRARARGINVKVFHGITEVNKYFPNRMGKNVLLSKDLLENQIPLSEILSMATSLGANKFILTNEFIETLEKEPARTKYRDMIRFFVYDEDRNYTIYPDIEESDIKDIALKYDAIILSSSLKACIEYKVKFIPYRLVSTCLEPTTQKPKKRSSDNDGVTGVAIPHYANQTNSISMKKLPINEKIWVLDGSKQQMKPSDKKAFEVKPGFTVIHGVNKLGYYKLDVYSIVANSSGKNIGKLIFTTEFQKDTVDNVDMLYRHYAKLLTIMT